MVRSRFTTGFMGHQSSRRWFSLWPSAYRCSKLHHHLRYDYTRDSRVCILSSFVKTTVWIWLCEVINWWMTVTATHLSIRTLLLYGRHPITVIDVATRRRFSRYRRIDLISRNQILGYSWRMIIRAMLLIRLDRAVNTSYSLNLYLYFLSWKLVDCMQNKREGGWL